MPLKKTFLKSFKLLLENSMDNTPYRWEDPLLFKRIIFVRT